MKCPYCTREEWHDEEICRRGYLLSIGINPDSISPEETESAIFMGRWLAGEIYEEQIMREVEELLNGS